MAVAVAVLTGFGLIAAAAALSDAGHELAAVGGLALSLMLALYALVRSDQDGLDSGAGSSDEAGGRDGSSS